jgi:hypothetical protein
MINMVYPGRSWKSLKIKYMKNTKKRPAVDGGSFYVGEK